MALKTASANRKDISTAARGVTLEHRHFCFIAASLKASKPLADDFTDASAVWHNVVDRFAIECAQSNPRFNRARFMSACGVES